MAKNAQNISDLPDKDVAATYYLRVFDKISESKEYLEKETKRISGMLEKHAKGTSQLAANKVDELTRKVNVLRALADEKLAETIAKADERNKEKKADEAAKAAKKAAHEEL